MELDYSSTDKLIDQFENMALKTQDPDLKELCREIKHELRYFIECGEGYENYEAGDFTPSRQVIIFLDEVWTDIPDLPDLSTRMKID